MSTTVDAQLEDYNSLPVNDAAIVDACVYETPGDPLTFSEPGEYDNPDGNQFKYSQDGTYDNPEFSAEPMDYTNPDVSVCSEFYCCFHGYWHIYLYTLQNLCDSLRSLVEL